MLVSAYKSVRSYNPEDENERLDRLQNLTSCGFSKETAALLCALPGQVTTRWVSLLALLYLMKIKLKQSGDILCFRPSA
jgi:hypothetical protein